MNFERLYREHYESIYRYAFRLLADAEEARDITQEVFVRLFNHLKRNSQPQHASAWLYRVATNQSLNLLKQTRRRRRLLQENPEPPRSTATAEEELVKKERIVQVRIAIDSLPARDRVLLMLYQDKLSYGEMARITGIKKSSIGKMLARAIEKLSKCCQTELIR